MPQPPQTLKNHARLLPPFHFFVIPVLFINFLNEIRHVYAYPSRSTVWALVVAAALLTLGFLSRTMVLTVQDRVIRLEMRQRLKDTLPIDLRGRITELTPKQLIALRFAGDDEMPVLVREVLAGSLATPKAIKQRVKNWQADYMRC
jgi:Family of unknown function (DUF6526)